MLVVLGGVPISAGRRVIERPRAADALPAIRGTAISRAVFRTGFLRKSAE